MVLSSMTMSDPYARFQGHRVTVDALDVLCAQLTRDLLTIAKFLLNSNLNLVHICSIFARDVTHKRGLCHRALSGVLCRDG